MVLPGLLSADEVTRLESWVAGLASHNTDAAGLWRHHYERINGERVLTRTEGFLYENAEVRVLLQERVAQIVGLCMGEPAMVFKEKINYKHPGGAGYAPHQDAPAYPLGTRHITCMIAIDEATPANGGLEFVAARHRQGLLPRDENGCIAPDLAVSMPWQAAPCPRGGALLFDALTPHRSGPNRSRISRRMLYVTYTPASEGDLRSAYYDLKSERLSEGRVSLIGHFQGELES